MPVLQASGLQGLDQSRRRGRHQPDPAGGIQMRKNEGREEERSRILEDYTCSMCGVTLETCHQWGPICKKTGKRVCDACCYRCEHRVSWSGIWRCGYIDPEQKKLEARQRAQARFDAESLRISQAYRANRRAQARQRAAKSARAGAGKDKR